MFNVCVGPVCVCVDVFTCMLAFKVSVCISDSICEYDMITYSDF